MVERIKKIMQDLGITQKELSDELQLSKGTISHILSGRNKPSIEFIEKLKNRYPNVSLDYLIIGKGNSLDIKNNNSPSSLDIDNELERISFMQEQSAREIKFQLESIYKKLKKQGGI